MLNDIEIIGPTKNSYQNKNGLYSAFGMYGEQKVKVYENFNEEQVKLRLFIDQCDLVNGYFPKVVLSKGTYVAEEYIHGRKATLSDNLEEDLVDFLLKLKSLRYNSTTWDYIKHIFDRVDKKYIDPSTKSYINHNDITYDNIIISENGFKIIDNEFLACNNAYFLNCRNSNILCDNSLEYNIDMERIDFYWDVRRSWNKWKN